MKDNPRTRGAIARAAALSPERRREIAQRANAVRNANKTEWIVRVRFPTAVHDRLVRLAAHLRLTKEEAVVHMIQSGKLPRPDAQEGVE